LKKAGDHICQKCENPLAERILPNGTKNCYGIGMYQTRISNLIETMTVVFHPSSRSKVGANEEKSSWACVQDVS
jgi:hypothetical protein